MSKKKGLAIAAGVALGAAGAAFGTLLATSRLVFRSGLVRDSDADDNFDPALHDPYTFPPTGPSPLRIAAREGNVWWNSQPLERLILASEDGIALTGHLLRAQIPTDRLAFVVHGHKSVSGELGFLCRMYHEMGYHVFAPDQRAHGKSGGRYIGMGYLERRDMIGWLHLLCETLPGCSIILHGVSMGAATVMFTAAEPDLPDNVRCAVEDCGYTTAWESFAYTLQHNYPFMPCKKTILRLTDVQCGMEAGWHFRDANVLTAVRECRVPMLFIHGTVDDVVPFWMQKRLYDAHPGDKVLLAVEGARHGTCYFHDPVHYRGAVEHFAARFLAV